MSTDWEASFHHDLSAALSTDAAHPHVTPLACDEDRVFRGSLERLPLAQVVRLLHESRKSGVLVLRHGAQEDRIFLRRGEVLAATAGAARGVAAFYRLLGRDSGHFRFEARRVHPARTIFEATESLLAAGALQSATAAESARASAEAALALSRTSLTSWTAGRAGELLGAARRGTAALSPRLAGLRAAAAARVERGHQRDVAVVASAAALLLTTGVVAALSGHPSAPAAPAAASAPSMAQERGEADLAAVRASNARTRAELAEIERRVLMLSSSIAQGGFARAEGVSGDGTRRAARPPSFVDGDPDAAAAALSLSPRGDVGRATAPRHAGDPDLAAAALSLSPLRRH